MSEFIITLLSPLANLYASLDFCKTCYTLRHLNDDKFRESKVSSMASLRSFATVNALSKTEKEFKESLDKLNEASEICCSTEKPNDDCYKRNQEALNATLNMFLKKLESPDTKRKLGL